MKPNEHTPLARSKIELIKYICHQLNPFTYAVSTFLRPALEECQTTLNNDPVNTLNLLIKLSQTFVRTAPEPELIHDDIKRFAVDLRSIIEKCMIGVDLNQIKHPPNGIEGIIKDLQSLIETAVSTNLERINLLPTENSIQLSSYTNNHSPNSNRYSSSVSPTIHEQQQTLFATVNETSTIPSFSNRHEITQLISNRHSNGSFGSTNLQFQQSSSPQPLQATNCVQDETLSSCIQHTLPSIAQQQQQQSDNHNLASLIKNLSITPTSNFLINREETSVSYLNKLEVNDTARKSTVSIASFPPRSLSSLAENTYTNAPSSLKAGVVTTINGDGYHLSSLLKSTETPAHLQDISEDNHEKNLINLAQKQKLLAMDTTYVSQEPSTTLTVSERTEDSEEDINDYEQEEKDFVEQTESKQYYVRPSFNNPQLAATLFVPCKQSMSVIDEESIQNQSLAKNEIIKRHITDDYIREWSIQRERPALQANCFMTYNNQQNSLELRRGQPKGSLNSYDQIQNNCLPIGVSLTNDDSTLLSCDVHVNSNCVRLYNVQNGHLTHSISRNEIETVDFRAVSLTSSLFKYDTEVSSRL
ncbi:unnamed protein product, partial [Didymodactylos carnosus]